MDLDYVTNKLTDIYDASYGRILTFPRKDYKLVDLALELISTGKIGTIQPHLTDPVWVMCVRKDLRPSEVIKLIEQSEYMSGENFSIKLPDNFNLMSFRSLLYSTLRAKGLKYQISIKKGQLSLSTKHKYADIDAALTNLTKDGREFFIKDPAESQRFVKTVYRRARLLGLNVTLSDRHPNIFVRLVVKEEVKKKLKKTSWLKDLNDFFALLKYDEVTPLPIYIRADMNDNYIRSQICKSEFDISFKNGMLCKHSHRIRRINGRVVLRIHGETVHIFDKLEKPSDMKEKDWKMVDLILDTYGLSRYDS